MCQRIIQFCTGSTKALVFAGSLFTSALAVGLTYLACSANSLYQDIDPSVAQSRSLAYYLQLLASAYLILIGLLACFAAHYDQKHLTRALAILTSLNFLLAVGAILMVPTGPEVGLEFSGRLTEAIKLYNFTDRPAVKETQPMAMEAATATASPAPAANASAPTADRTKRLAPGAADGAGQPLVPVPAPLQAPLNQTCATHLWDRLQARGCCGIHNATTDWKDGLPKSCCSGDALEERQAGKLVCKALDAQHQRPCLEVIGTVNLHLLLALALVALVNLYLATITGISAYRTLHYDEASQNAYT